MRTLPAFLVILLAAASPQDARAADPVLSDPTPPPAAPAAPERKADPEDPGTKAGPSERPTQVPDFTLPEVVITGENQLTIGARRRDVLSRDVALGTRDLSRLERTGAEVPGLERARAALSSAEGEPRELAGILRVGGGTPETLGGWGLLAWSPRDLTLLLSAHGDRYGGEEAGVGRTAFSRRGFDFQVGAEPAPGRKVLARREFRLRKSDLPHGGGEETRTAVPALLRVEGSLTGSLSAAFTAGHRVLEVERTVSLAGRAESREQDFGFEFRLGGVEGPVGAVLRAEHRRGSGDFTSGAPDAYRASRVDWEVTARKPHGRVAVEAWGSRAVHAGLLPEGEFHGRAGLSFRPARNVQVGLSLAKERDLPDLFGAAAYRPYTSIGEGFHRPPLRDPEAVVEVRHRGVGRSFLSWKASTALIRDYVQWNDRADGTGSPEFLFAAENLPEVRVRALEARFERELGPRLSLTGFWRLQDGELHGASGGLTDFPKHSGSVGVRYRQGVLEGSLRALGQGERRAFRRDGGSLPRWVRVDGSLSLRAARNLTLWAEGENLAGERYEEAPGYPAPRFHLTAGLQAHF